MTNASRSLDIELYLHGQTDPRLHEVIGPIVIGSGEGARVRDDSGREFIEGMSGLWCASLGFSEKRIADVAREQMARLAFYHSSNHRSNERVIELAELIRDISPISPCRMSFFASGSEANESMIKIAWYYNTARGKPDKRKIISRHGAYHGGTIFASVLSGLPHLHRAFNLPRLDVIYATRPSHFHEAREGESHEAFGLRLAAELEEIIEREGADTIAAMIVEPVMGAGGLMIPPDNYFPLVQQILRRNDILLLSDEIICGFGRTGKWFGSQTLGFTPDMMTIAKGLSAGHFPISGVVFSDEIYQVIADQAASIGWFGHGFTYAGHPVGAAIAAEAIRIYHEIDVLGRVERLGGHLRRRLDALSRHPNVGETRSIGFMAGVELVDNDGRRFDPSARAGAEVEKLCRSNGLIIRNMGDTIALCPPYVATEAEIDEIVDILSRSIDAFSDRLAGGAPGRL